MNLLLKGAYVFNQNGFEVSDVFISDGSAVPFCDESLTPDEVINLDGRFIFPGLTDVHVHLREPGFSYKETIKTGTAAAASGGFTTICSMPNLNPSPDGRTGLDTQLDIIKKSAKIRVIPYGAITKGSLGIEISDLETMPDAVAFTDDGRGTSEEILKTAMLRARVMGKLISSHCEDVSLKGGDHIAVGSPYTGKLGIAGISNESEYVQLERELKVAEKTGCAYHMCHISCRESVELIRRAKSRGINVTCETAPHYIVLDYNDITEDDGRFKMNPPLRSPDDRRAIIEGIADGTIDMIATDHAPHSAAEKGRGLTDSAMGVVGLETAFAVCYTALVKTGIISLYRLVELMSVSPAKRFGIESASHIWGSKVDLTVFDLESKYNIKSDGFISMGKSSPFTGREVYGECLLTIAGGKIVYRKGE